MLGIMLLGRPYVAAIKEARDRVSSEGAVLARERALVEAADSFGLLALSIETGLQERIQRVFDREPTIAVGALARYVTERAAESFVLVESTTARQMGDVGASVVVIRVEMRALSDIEGVLRFLDRLEGGPRIVHVERLHLERREPFGPDFDDPVQIVAINATLAGYVFEGPRESQGGQ